MLTSDDGASRESPQRADRLDSWKAIAEYLGKGITTVRRWERDEGLPVYRQEHVKRGSVVAYRRELDRWVESRMGSPPEPAPEAPGRSRVLTRIGVTAAVASAILFVWVIAERPAREDSIVVRLTAITNGPQLEGPPDLSPDGTLVAYSVKGPPANGIYVKPVEGGDAVQITEGDDEFPRWSPDGKRIVFSRYGSQWRDVMMVPSGGGAEKPVFRRKITNGFRTAWASWMADGVNLLVVDNEDADRPAALFRLSTKTGEKKRLTSPPASAFGDMTAASSPDGERIAFVRWHRGAEGDLYVMPTEGGEARRLTHDAAYLDGVGWEPGGKHLIFASTRLGASGRLWRLPADGTGSPELIQGIDRDAIWPSVASVEGHLRIAFQWVRETVNIRQWDEPGRQGSTPRLLAPSNFSELAAQYSPDGTRVAFVSTRSGGREIWVGSAEGTGLRQLTHSQGAFTDVPRWSPDGRQIAFTTSANDNRDVYVVAAEGGESRRLTTEPSEEGRPSWSCDGRWIWFRSNRSGSEEIWKIPSSGSGPARQMTRGGGYEAFEGPDGRWLYYAKGRKYRGIWRIPVDGGQEEMVTGDVREGWWAATRDGLFFVRPEPYAIWKLAFGRASAELVAPIEGQGGLSSGFSARFDGRSFLYSQATNRVADVVVADPVPGNRVQ